jgi:hypothetical protein
MHGNGMNLELTDEPVITLPHSGHPVICDHQLGSLIDDYILAIFNSRELECRFRWVMEPQAIPPTLPGCLLTVAGRTDTRWQFIVVAKNFNDPHVYMRL